VNLVGDYCLCFWWLHGAVGGSTTVKADGLKRARLPMGLRVGRKWRFVSGCLTDISSTCAGYGGSGSLHACTTVGRRHWRVVPQWAARRYAACGGGASMVVSRSQPAYAPPCSVRHHRFHPRNGLRPPRQCVRVRAWPPSCREWCVPDHGLWCISGPSSDILSCARCPQG